MDGWNKKRRMMSRYDVTADIYDLRYEKEQIAKFEVALKDDVMRMSGLVLDVGCGTGLLFQRIAEKSVGVLGLDISRKSLINAKKKAKELGNVHLVLADVDHMPLSSRVFDGVYAFTIIQNMPNPAYTLAEMRNVAKVGATIVVTGLKKCFHRNAFMSLLETAGFRIVRFEDEISLRCYVAVCQDFTP